MVDEDSHSTDLNVSGEEGHSTILLAHYLFLFNWGQSYLVMLVTPQNWEMLLLLYYLHILASHQKRFCFFEQLLSNIFEKLRETF